MTEKIRAMLKTLTDLIPHRLHAIRRRRGVTLEKLEEKTGVSNGHLSRIEKGKKRLNLEMVDRLAEGLDVDPISLIVDVDSFETIEVRGTIQGGQWVEKLWWGPDKLYTIAIPSDPRHKAGTRYGLEVRGTASNLRYPEGTIVLFISLPENYIPEEPDVRFLVERRSGDMCEYTIRKFFVDSRGQRWLMTETTDPEYQFPVPYEDLLTGKARVIARVVGNCSFE